MGKISTYTVLSTPTFGNISDIGTTFLPLRLASNIILAISGLQLLHAKKNKTRKN